MCEGATGFEKNWIYKFSQGPALVQPQTKFAMLFLCSIDDDKELFIHGYADLISTTFLSFVIWLDVWAGVNELCF